MVQFAYFLVRMFCWSGKWFFSLHLFTSCVGVLRLVWPNRGISYNFAVVCAFMRADCFPQMYNLEVLTLQRPASQPSADCAAVLASDAYDGAGSGFHCLNLRMDVYIFHIVYWVWTPCRYVTYLIGIRRMNLKVITVDSERQPDNSQFFVTPEAMPWRPWTMKTVFVHRLMTIRRRIT